MRRFPLWVTIVPLMVGVGVYWHFWSGYRDAFRADIDKVLPGATIKIGGFPYRMEGEVVAPAVSGSGKIGFSASATRAIFNRGPWQRDLTVIRTIAPRARAAVDGVRGSVLDLSAVSGMSSLHLDHGRVARQSNVFASARLTTGLLAAPIRADKFEVHIRELSPRSYEAWSATPPQHVQIVLSANAARIGNGAPLTL
ncbi:MAG: hypothetical protein ACRYG4_28025, partial [Janthinobacterium lividum]